MGANSKIEWCHHTFNAWRGCYKNSPGCKFCYAERGSHRNPEVLGIWGKDTQRVIASESMWQQPIKWNRQAERNGDRYRVFCNSYSDVFEPRDDLNKPRRRLFDLIKATPRLDWLLLTKFPEAIKRLVPAHWLKCLGMPRNVWLGTSVENQEMADKRIPSLLKRDAPIRFISAEPLLGPINLTAWSGLDWVIIGGESGSKSQARPCDMRWVATLIQDCQESDVRVFVKQLGTNPISCCRLAISDPKGGNPVEWPYDLSVREFPESPMETLA